MKLIVNESQFEIIKNEIILEETISKQIKGAQIQLNQLGANLTVNGIYDESTKEAIQNFQRENNFPLQHQTGGLDSKTKTLLFNIINKPKNIQSSKTNKIPLETPEFYNEKIRNYVEIIKRIVRQPTNNGINYLYTLYKWFKENNIGAIISIEDLYRRIVGKSPSGELYYISTHDNNFKNNKMLKDLIYYTQTDLIVNNKAPLKVMFPPKNIDNFNLNGTNNNTTSQIKQPKQPKQLKHKNKVPYHNCSKKYFPYEYGCMGVPQIKELQMLLGVKSTGNYGPLTYKALNKISKDVRNTGITLELYNNIKIQYSPRIDTQVSQDNGTLTT